MWPISRELAGQIIQLSPNIPSEASIILRNIENPSFLIHFHFQQPEHRACRKQKKLLELNNIETRAESVNEAVTARIAVAELKNKVTTKPETELDKQQREYFLQQQMKSIKRELGGDNNEQEMKEMLKKGRTKKWNEASAGNVQKRHRKLERMHPSTPITRWCIITSI